MHSVNDEKNRRILVIDDNPTIHDDIRSVLAGDEDSAELQDAAAALFGQNTREDSQIRYDVDSAMQGQEGLAKVVEAVKRERPYAVAFVDMRMPPGWDGVETIEQLWRKDPDLQVVICTAYSDYSWSDIVARLGQTDQLLILRKPFDTAELGQLATALSEKWGLARQARLKMSELERMIEDRTVCLHEVNDRLQTEIEKAQDRAVMLERSNAELEKAVAELREFNELTEGRELKMIELKTEINDLAAKFGEPQRYNLEFDEDQAYHPTAEGVQDIYR